MDRVDALEQQARDATSLDNFGADCYREGLEALVRSADREARFTTMGRAAFDAQIVGLLSNRLQVEHWYHMHPEIDEQQIKAPLIGLGLPRTGSTALSNLLAADPAVRTIRNWEAQWPCPPPESESQYDDPRIAKAEESMARRNRLFPRMKMMVPSTATSPTECQTYMGMNFTSQLFQSSARIPSYVEWLHHKADLAPTYLYVKRVLKLLQWRCPPRAWRLKNPSHILFIDALSQVFPDARFWMTHREVGSVLPSVADLYFELHQAFTDQVDKLWLGTVNTEFCELGMRRMMAFRDKGNEHRFFDIQFTAFQRDPFPVVQQLYDFLGEKLTAETRAGMIAWRENTPADKHGAHTCNPADFGLDLAKLHERFRFYTDRFQVTR